MAYGLFGGMTAEVGRRDELVDQLLRVAEHMQADPGCLQYLGEHVGRSGRRLGV